MEEVKKLIEKGIRRVIALIVCWDKLSQSEKEALDFKTLSEVWESFPGMKGKDEVWSLLKKEAKNFDHHKFILKNTFGDKLVFFDILKKRAKTFNQKFWLWENIDSYSGRENDAEKKAIWNELKKMAKTVKLIAKLWAATEQDSEEEKEAFVMLKENAKKFSDLQYLLEDVFSFSTSEWKEIYVMAEEKVVSFENYVYLWQHELHTEKEETRWKVLQEKADTVERAIDLFLYANDDESANCLTMARAKL